MWSGPEPYKKRPLEGAGLLLSSRGRGGGTFLGCGGAGSPAGSTCFQFRVLSYIDYCEFSFGFVCKGSLCS